MKTTRPSKHDVALAQLRERLRQELGGQIPPLVLHPTPSEIHDAVSGDLAAKAASQVKSHLLACAACKGHADALIMSMTEDGKWSDFDAAYLYVYGEPRPGSPGTCFGEALALSPVRDTAAPRPGSAGTDFGDWVRQPETGQRPAFGAAGKERLRPEHHAPCGVVVSWSVRRRPEPGAFVIRAWAKGRRRFEAAPVFVITMAGKTRTSPGRSDTGRLDGIFAVELPRESLPRIERVAVRCRLQGKPVVIELPPARAARRGGGARASRRSQGKRSRVKR